MAADTAGPAAALFDALIAISTARTHSEMPHRRARQRGHAGRAGEDDDTSVFRRSVHRLDAAYEFAAVGYVDIMNPGGDAGPGNGVVHRLERARCIHHQGRPVLLQRRGNPASVQRQRDEAGRCPAKGLRLVERPSRDQYLMPRASEPPGDTATKAAIAAEEQDAGHRMRDACSAVGIQQADLSPNSR
jgi:hypothetical protein